MFNSSIFLRPILSKALKQSCFKSKKRLIKTIIINIDNKSQLLYHGSYFVMLKKQVNVKLCL